ncbi:MAG: sigma-70 family RNA polymerase sigma factor [Gemmatimonadales bacterium]
MTSAFQDAFVRLFETHFARIFRYLDRLSGDPDLAADLAQETFVRLYRRGAPPESAEAWLVTVATNLFRNDRATRRRRVRLLTDERARDTLADSPASPAGIVEADQVRDRVRAVLRRMPERERQLLLLRAEGYAYRDLAAGLGIPETSVGTLLARAKHAFRRLYEEDADAS